MADIIANPPYRYVNGKVFGVSHKPQRDDVLICDIRGWGYLTGHGSGALGLELDAAARIQDVTGRLIAKLLNEHFKEHPVFPTRKD